MILENIIYVLSFLNSSRIALNFLISFVFILLISYIFHDSIKLLSNTININPIAVYIVLFIFAYALAVLLIDLIQKLYNLVIKYIKIHKAIKRVQDKERSDRKERLFAIKRFLEHSPEENKKPLYVLMKLKEFEFYRDKNLLRLVEIGAIEELVETRRYHAVFRLTNEAEPVVREHYDLERKKYIQSVIETLTDDEIAFLKLFEECKTIYENQQGDELLPWNIYNGAETLLKKRLIEHQNTDKRSIEQWSLRLDAKHAIETYYGLNFKRDSLVLCLDKVQAIPVRGSASKSY